MNGRKSKLLRKAARKMQMNATPMKKTWDKLNHREKRKLTNQLKDLIRTA